jgi:hypothetical protein
MSTCLSTYTHTHTHMCSMPAGEEGTPSAPRRPEILRAVAAVAAVAAVETNALLRAAGRHVAPPVAAVAGAVAI